MADSILDQIAKEGRQGFTLALLFNSAPLELSGLLSDSALVTIEQIGSGTLGEYGRQVLSSEIASRRGKALRPLRLRLLDEESPFCFPVVFHLEDSTGGLCRSADIQLFCLQSNHQTPVHWPENFRRSCEEAITLADTMVPGNERPWARPCMPHLVREMDQPSGALAFFFATMCYLLDLPYPKQVICSAQLENGRFAPVSSIAEKARIAQQDGFSYFVVCGEQNRLEAERATANKKSQKRKFNVLALSEGDSPGDQFLDLIAQLTQTGRVWKDVDLNVLVDFLLNRAMLAARNDPILGFRQFQRIRQILRCLPEPGLDDVTDALRLDVLGALGAYGTRCRHCNQAKEAFDELQSICNRLLRKRQCPANFEDHWFALPLNRGLLAMHGYDYQRAKKLFVKAEKERKRRWPPSSRFEGLILQAQGRLLLMQGQTDAKAADAAPDYFRKAAKKLYPADRPENARLLAEALIQLGRFSAAGRHFDNARTGRPEQHAVAAASEIRARVLEGLVRGDRKILRKAVSQHRVYERQETSQCVPPWPRIASVFAALAAAPLHGRKESMRLLSILQGRLGKFENDDGWIAPVHCLQELWLAWFAIQEDDATLMDRATASLARFVASMDTEPLQTSFGNLLGRLHGVPRDDSLPILRTLITRVQYSVPASLFDPFVKNL